jgi:hypothetical protein
LRNLVIYDIITIDISFHVWPEGIRQIVWWIASVKHERSGTVVTFRQWFPFEIVLFCMFVACGGAFILYQACTLPGAAPRKARLKRAEEMEWRYEWHALNICLYGTDEEFAKEMTWWTGREKRDFRLVLFSERERCQNALAVTPQT